MSKLKQIMLSPEATNKVLRQESIINLSHAFFDMYVEYNMNIRQGLGLKEIISRRQVGKCCDWCQDRVGVYAYGEHPPDIFRRHAYCKCMVTHKTQKGVVDVWSKKEYATQRKARISREKEIYDKDHIYSKYNRLKRIAKDQGEWCYDVTQEWRELSKYSQKGRVTKATNIVINGKAYPIDGHLIKMEPSIIEVADAKLITEELGGTIKLMPKVNEPKSVKSADYIYNGQRFDNKNITTDSSTAIKNRLNNSVHEGQSNSFVVDVTGNPRTDVQIREDVKFAYKKVFNLETVIIVRNGNIISIFERI